MNSSETFADLAFERLSRALAGRSTRRSLLGRAGRLMLAALGIQLLPAQPFDARALGQQTGQQCVGILPQYCGVYGTPCSFCGGGASDNACPPGSGCTQGSSFWCACCNIGVTNRIVRYYDCCRTGTPLGCTPTCLDGVNCDPGKIAWCPAGTGKYCCTVVTVTQQLC